MHSDAIYLKKGIQHKGTKRNIKKCTKKYATKSVLGLKILDY